MLDLDTMKREPIPYGTIFANGFKLETPIENHSHYLDWKEFKVDDGTAKRSISKSVNEKMLLLETSPFKICTSLLFELNSFNE